LTVKQEISEMIDNNVTWNDDDTCTTSEDLPEKIIKILTKKLDEKIKIIKDDMKKNLILSSIRLETKIETLQDFKKELEK